MHRAPLSAISLVALLTLLIIVFWGCSQTAAGPDQQHVADSLRVADSLHVADSLRIVDSLQHAGDQHYIDSVRHADSVRIADSTALFVRRGAVFCDLVHNVILPTLHDFDLKATTLRNSIDVLNMSRNKVALELVHNSWLDLRPAWEQSEAFLFGPAKTQQIDPAVDSWPADIITIDSMLVSIDQLTEAYFSSAEGSVKGMHTIEYLIWGDNGKKTVGEITMREYEFLLGASASLQKEAHRLYLTWAPASEGGSDYGWQICNAGMPGSLYTTQNAGLRDYLNGIITITIELSDAKLGIPFNQRTNEFEESRFSGASLADFNANLLGLQSIYMGAYGNHSGKGLRDLVAAVSPELDAKVQQKIADAIDRLKAIPSPFSTAIVQNRNSIITARTALTDLYNLLQHEVTDSLGVN
jgi:putative iron-regulated protein